MATSELEVWTAIYSVLKNNAGLIALLPYSDGKTAVFDDNNVPLGLNPPYLVLGTSISTPDNTFIKKGLHVVATIDGWSEYKGKEQVLKMRDAVFNALDYASLSLGSNFRCISCLYDSGQLIPDNSTSINKWHMTDRYRIGTEAI